MVKKTILFSLLLLLITLLWNQFLPKNFHSVYAPFILLYFFVSIMIVHPLLMKSNKKSSQSFIRAYMGSTAIRLFSSILIIFIFLLINKNQPERITFAVTFMFYYFSFQIFEVVSLLKELLRKS